MQKKTRLIVPQNITVQVIFLMPHDREPQGSTCSGHRSQEEAFAQLISILILTTRAQES